MRNQSKEKRITSATDSERETRVLLEEVRSDVKTIAEQHGSIMTKLKEHDGRFVRIDQKLEQHDLQFLKMDHRFDKLEKRFTGLEQRFDRLDNQFVAVITDHESRLKVLEDK